MLGSVCRYYSIANHILLHHVRRRFCLCQTPRSTSGRSELKHQADFPTLSCCLIALLINGSAALADSFSRFGLGRCRLQSFDEDNEKMIDRKKPGPRKAQLRKSEVIEQRRASSRGHEGTTRGNDAQVTCSKTSRSRYSRTSVAREFCVAAMCGSQDIRVGLACYEQRQSGLQMQNNHRLPCV